MKYWISILHLSPWGLVGLIIRNTIYKPTKPLQKNQKILLDEAGQKPNPV